MMWPTQWHCLFSLKFICWKSYKLSQLPYIGLSRRPLVPAVLQGSNFYFNSLFLSMTSLRPLSRCKGLTIARKIQGCNDVSSAKLICNALINSPQHSTLHASLPKCSIMATTVFLSTSDMAYHSDGSSNILINLLALCDEIERISSLHEWLQLFAPLSICCLSYGVKIDRNRWADPNSWITIIVLNGG